MSSTIRVGVVGGGWPARMHLDAYKAVAGVEVVAICDIDADHAESVAEEFGVPNSYSSHSEMLAAEKLDAVSVCTPNITHAGISVDAMEAGAHVLCEKPLASTVALGQKVMEARDRTGKLFMMGYQRRYGLAAQQVKTAIDSGDLGEIYFVRSCWTRRIGIPGLGGWFTNRALSGGGSLIDIGVHVLDLGLWFMGFPEPTGVSGSWGSHFGVHGLGGSSFATRKIEGKHFDVDDYAVAHVRFGGGRSLLLQSSWASHTKEDEMTVEVWGTKGGAKLRPLEFFTTDGGIPRDITPRIPEVSEFELEVQHFVDCIETGKQPESSIEQGLATLELIDRIYSEGESNMET